MSENQKTNNPTIRNQIPADKIIIEQFIETTFGPGRYSKPSYVIREYADKIQEASFIALNENNECVGINSFFLICFDFELGALMGPLAIKKNYRNNKLANDLINRGLQIIQKQNNLKFCLTIGEEEFFSKFGFKIHPMQNEVKMPLPFLNDSLLIKILSDNYTQQPNNSPNDHEIYKKLSGKLVPLKYSDITATVL